jgi:hypothetical protein
MNHAALYSELRCQLLSRHYALGRYWRANHFTDVYNQLAAWPLTHDTHPRNFACVNAQGTPCDKVGERPKQWTGPAPVGSGLYIAELPIYPDANTLIQAPDGSQLALERWRIFRHDRSNSLMNTGLRLISLCVDHQLGDPWAIYTIKLILDTLNSLFKFAPNGNFYNGYILRWDPASSDNWSVTVTPNDNKSVGGETPHTCCDFIANPDPNTNKNQPFLYCSPFGSSSYQSVNDKGLYRRWEPSLDEYVGLLTGYMRVFDTFQPTGSGSPWPVFQQQAVIREQIREQILELVRTHVKWIATYLQHFGYFLVRPGCSAGSHSINGFTGLGATGFNCCMQYPFSRIFARITGDPHVPNRDNYSFRGALRNAGVLDMWDNYPVQQSAAEAETAFLNSEIWSVLKKLLNDDPRNVLRDTCNLAPDAVASVIADAAAVLVKPGCFDVLHTQESDNHREGIMQFALAAILNPIAAVKPELVFSGWMSLYPNLFPNARACGDGFRFWLALSALDDSDTTVKEQYGKFYKKHIIPNITAPGVDPADKDETLNKEGWCEEAFGTAVYNLLFPDDCGNQLPPDDPNNLEGVVSKKLAQMRKTLLNQFNQHLVLWDHEENTNEYDDHCTHEFADKRNGAYFGYMSALSLAWLQQMRRQKANPAGHNINSTGEPTPTNIVAQIFKRPIVPPEVITAAIQQAWPVPINDIQTGVVPHAGQPDMFLITENSPQKPPDYLCGDRPQPIYGPVFQIEKYAFTPDIDWASLTPEQIVQQLAQHVHIKFTEPLPPLPLAPLGMNPYQQCQAWFTPGFVKTNVLDGSEKQTRDVANQQMIFELDFKVWRTYWDTDGLGPPVLKIEIYRQGVYKGGCQLVWTA